MCTYITAVIPARADEAAVRRCADEWGHGWAAIDNRYVLGQLRPGERYYLTTRKHCDCGTALGSLGPEWEHRPDDPTEKIPALRRRGWSGAKIARWLKDKERAAGHRQRTAALGAGHPAMPEEELWLGFLRAAVAGGLAESVGLLLHWYSGRVESERIDLENRTRVPLGELDETVLRNMAYDHLYEVRR